MLVVFVLYLLVLAGITLYTARKSKSAGDFVLGGKKIPGFALAVSERATGESAWLLLGLTGEAYLIGMQSVWIALGCVAGILFIWNVMGNRLRIEAEKSGALTIPGLLAARFSRYKRSISYISAFIIVFFFLFYIEAQFYGGGKVLQDTFGIHPVWGMIAGSLVVVLYTMLGGFITVVWTDVLQGILMIITLIVLPLVVLFFAASADINIAASIESAGESYSSLTAGKSGSAAWLLVLGGLSWMFGYTGQPQLLSRMMAVRNKRDIRIARTTATVWTLFAYAGALLIGFAGFAFVREGFLGQEQAKLAQDCEKILPVMINTFVNPVIAGLLLSGVISAMMSTASSEIIVSSSVITEDVFELSRRKNISQKRGLLINRLVALVAGLTAFIMALTMNDSVYGLVSYAWSGIGSSFGPALLLLLFWKRMSGAGVVASLITGTVSTIIWKYFFLPETAVTERLVSFFAALLMAIAFSLIFPQQKKLYVRNTQKESKPD